MRAVFSLAGLVVVLLVVLVLASKALQRPVVVPDVQGIVHGDAGAAGASAGGKPVPPAQVADQVRRELEAAMQASVREVPED